MSTRRAARLILSLSLVAASVLGFAALNTPTAALAAGTASSVTVAWAGGNDEALEQFQPDHAALTSDGTGNDAGSGHWDEFKNVQATVSKTQGLDTEVITVDVSGMLPTTYPGFQTQNASNYLQIFQCWGQDPTDADFAQTCQFGSMAGDVSFGGLAAQASLTAAGAGADTTSRGYLWDDTGGQAPYPFRAVYGSVSTPVTEGGSTWTGLNAFFGPSTSNEQPFIKVGADGTATTKFEVQSAAAAPHLGCGDPDSAAGYRCWLVIVPRGSHSGNPEGASTCWNLQFPSPYGASTGGQVGSPIVPNCTYFADRIVVPLDFNDAYSRCPAGAAERRIVGSELVVAAVSSWQPALCAGEGSATYNMATNSGDLTRGQLLTGQVGMGLVAEPATSANIAGADATMLDEAQLAYAPVANTALTIAYVAQTTEGNVYTDLKLTPRLLAKLITSSYRSQLPFIEGSGYEVGLAYDRTIGLDIFSDPEWVALGNPTDLPFRRGAFVVSGPQGDDALKLLWEYIQADADAVAFLKGEADPWGGRVNPYFLTSTNPDAAGGGLPYDLASEPVETIPKADQTLVPDPDGAALRFNGIQLDTLTAFPYAQTLHANAVRIFRLDTQNAWRWDPQKLTGTKAGAFAAGGPQLLATGAWIAGPADAATAASYGLASAQLPLPVATVTTAETVASARTFVAATDASMTAAVDAMQMDLDSGTWALDFAALPEGAYPLTTTIHAAVNLAPGTLDASARIDYGRFLQYAAADGQTPGQARGQLPAGFVPLTQEQSAATRALAEELAKPETTNQQPPARTTTTTPPAGTGNTPPPSQVTTSQSQEPVVAATPVTSTPAGGVVGGTLLAGLAGLVASPFLLRRGRL